MPVNVGDMICNLDSEKASIVSEPNYCTKCSLFNKFFLVRNKLKIVPSCRLEMCVMFHDAMVIVFPCSTTQIVFNKLQYEFMTRTLRYKHRKYLYLKLKSTQQLLVCWRNRPASQPSAVTERAKGCTVHVNGLIYQKNIKQQERSGQTEQLQNTAKISVWDFAVRVHLPVH